jgi:hypothetical protein
VEASHARADLRATPATAVKAAVESLRDSLRSSTEPKVVIRWFYLGELALEGGRMDEAKAEYLRYLRATDTIRDNSNVTRLREAIHKYGVECAQGWYRP